MANWDTPLRGIILFGHGSRDPLWRQPMETVAARLRERAGTLVRCAYLEITARPATAAAAESAKAAPTPPHRRADVPGRRAHARRTCRALMAQLQLRASRWLLRACSSPSAKTRAGCWSSSQRLHGIKIAGA
jgi:sirohydrochlorin cobaltochelatase